ncbi:hypothetical protein [Streptodolium elevatio]|uniref:Uncharacterized protein n=1 Tax=Streptodolium elevatio TaxID=3157996 RepID=A0ABV3DV61_9ACTN
MMTRSTETHDPASVALELAELRRSVDVGFATTRGDLALLLQRADQADKVLDEHDARICVSRPLAPAVRRRPHRPERTLHIRVAGHRAVRAADNERGAVR